MAILKREGADQIYAVGRLFREQALERDGSLLTPGRPIWTGAALDELHERFTLQPDSSKDGFEQKLKRQLDGASDAAIQLMAELLLVHVFVSMSIGGEAKQRGVSAVLSWMSEPVSMPDEIGASLAYGLGRTGTHFNTARDRHLRFLIEWIRAWKSHPADVREQALRDPWAFKADVHAIEVNAAWMQRNILLHLLFPEAFERMFSRADKQAAIDAFADRVGGQERAKTLDEDRALLEIREVLAQEYGAEFDFYDTPAVRALWKPVEPSGDEAADSTVPLLDRVLAAYPGWTGFSDPRFIKDESNYKRTASENAQNLLGAGTLRGLIDEGRLSEVISRVEKVGQSTNLLWLQVPKDGDLSLLYRQGLDQAEFAEQLYDLLHGEGESPARLGRFADYTTARGLPTKWALPTYLLMLLHPESDFFVKPQATKWFLGEVDAGFDLSSKASGEVYSRILEEVGALREALARYGPQSTVDVQGYIWVAYRTHPAETPASEELAWPFSSAFSDWESAWWAFDVAKDVLVQIGVQGPADERLAATIVDGHTIHVDVASWLVLGFGTEKGKQHQFAFAMATNSELRESAQGGSGFAADPAVTVGYLPLADARERFESVKAAMVPALDSARELFAGHARSPYRVHNRPELAAAIFDETERDRLLREGIESMSDPSSVYDHIAEAGFHFPDWLVTNYVLSLATKPLVILSGISGTGKTKMAQLVSEHVAPEVMVPVARSLPEPNEVSILHEAKRVLIEHFYVAIRTRQADLFPLPERGSGLDVELRAPGLEPMPGRLQSIGGERDDGLTLRLYLKGPARDWVRSQFKRGDYIRITPEGPDSSVIGVEHIAVDTVETPAPSKRIAFLSVRPDWTDNRALLGYYNPLTQKYQSTELLRLLLRAQANPDEPHFVILDEMNLAKVEYYFSDFLSAVEADSELVLHDAGEDLILEALDGMGVPQRLKVPANVFFTGTVNVDETTYMFSPKVLDRANTLEFNEVDLAQYGAAVTDDTGSYRLRPEVSVESLLAAYRKPQPQDWLELPAPYAERLQALHALMAQHNLHFGYRVANEIARYLNLAAAFVGPDALETAYDLQVLQKVLPKLSGSRAKLEGPLTDILEHLAKEDLPLSAAKVGRMLRTVQSVGFVSFVE